MSKAKFDAAKELIKEKNYDEALTILSTIDHPTAREWENKIYRLSPPTRAPVKVQLVESKPKRKSSTSGCLVLLVIVVIAVLWANNDSRNKTQPRPAGARVAPTVVAKGTRDNPYATGEAGSIRDGRFQVNSITRGATAAVENMNMFNTDPDPGEEWILAEVTFYCDLASSETCNVSQMNLEIVGDLGNLYSSELLTVLDNQFEGEVFGGGKTTGTVGFIVQSNDNKLMVVVNDLGDRIFFKG